MLATDLLWRSVKKVWIAGVARKDPFISLKVLSSSYWLLNTHKPILISSSSYLYRLLEH